jgi:hypothetical protein
MVASILILAVSLVLFLYWFRYTCELILSTRSATSYVMGVSEAHGLSWGTVAPSLEHAEDSTLCEFRQALRSDFAKLDGLLSRFSADEADQLAFERGLLKGYFTCNCALFCLTRRLSEGLAKQMLSTMARVVEYQANMLGERSQLSEMGLS